MGDSELYQAASTGDCESFAALYRRCSPPLYRFVLRMSGDPALADEIVQEVFTALIEKPHLFDPARGRLQSYLYGAARNQLFRRAEKSARDRPLDDAFANGSEPAAPELTPLDGLTGREQIDAVRRAVLALPEPYRAAVVLCDLEELSYAEAADALETAVGTIRSRLSRGRALLERKLALAASETRA